ncbi:MAG: DUF5668 domain-containing protein [Bacteroidota bacterium]
MKAMTKGTSSGRMIVGAVFVVIGSLLLLQRFDLVYFGSVWEFWPFIFVLIGISKIVNGFNAREYGAGIWMIFLGLWLYVSIQHLFGLSFSVTWPAMLIAWGCSMIWKSYFINSYRWSRG